MLQVINMQEVRWRARKAGLPLSRLADMAGIHHSTLFYGGRGRGSNSRSLSAAAAALARHERELLLHLLKLHGDPAGWPPPDCRQGRCHGRD